MTPEPKQPSMKSKRIFRTRMQEGEDLFSAILRAATTANEGEFYGYEVLCPCGRSINEHEPQDVTALCSAKWRPRDAKTT